MAYEKQTWTTGDLITDEKLNHIEEGISATDGEIGGLKEDLQSITKNGALPFHDAGNGGINQNTGNVAVSNFWHYTDYVSINGAKVIEYQRIESTDSPNNIGMAFYDADKNYLGGQKAIFNASVAGYQLTQMNVPTNAQYARFTIRPNDTYGAFSVSIINSVWMQIKSMNPLMTLLKKYDSLNNIAWAHGYVSSDGGKLAYSNNRTIVTPQFIYVTAGTTITMSDSYRLSVSLYGEPNISTFIDRTALETNAVTVSNDRFIRLHIAKNSDASDLDITDINDALIHVSISKPFMVLDPSVYCDAIEAESFPSASTRFIEAMNEKAQQIGMTSSIFADPAGYDTATNRVTARDMVRMGIEACAYNWICRIWNVDSYTITTLDVNHRPILCEYGDDVSALDSAYPLLGKKNGYMPLSGGGASYTMVAVCLVNDRVIIGAIGGATSRPNRPIAMKELMDNVKRSLEGVSVVTPTYYQYGCACELPKGNVASYGNRTLQFIYEYNADAQFVPASCTKVLTAMVMLDYVSDIHGKATALTSDNLSTGSGQLLVNGDVINYEQALYLMMLPSSGATCRVIARTIGQKMLIEYD